MSRRASSRGRFTGGHFKKLKKLLNIYDSASFDAKASCVLNATAVVVAPEDVNVSASFGSVSSFATNPGLSDTFDITSYGATGDGITDDTDAIQAALDAAGAVGGGIVLFPPGEYVIAPPGTMTTKLWQKISGAWVLLASGIAYETSVAGASNTVYFGPTPPTTEGVNGDLFFDYRAGMGYVKAGGIWSEDAKVISGSGTGWISYWTTPDASMGVDGQYCIDYYVTADKARSSCLQLTAGTHDNITMLGDPLDPGSCKLKFRVWSNGDPMDYVVSGGVVISAAIPTKSNNHYWRGAGFCTWRNGSDVTTNVVWNGLHISGQCDASGGHGYGTQYYELQQWDLSHKCLELGHDSDSAGTGVQIKNCIIEGWRGELIYRGGAGHYDVSITDNQFYTSNASAISISGMVTASGNAFKDIYNGYECYALDSYGDIQYLEIDGDYFDNAAQPTLGNFQPQQSIAYIGDELAHLTVTNCEFHDGKPGYGVIYASELADNVTIQGNTFYDPYWAVYANHISGAYGPAHFTTWLLQNNEVIATSGSIAAMFNLFNSSFTDVTIDGNTITDSGGDTAQGGIIFSGTAGSYPVVTNNTFDGVNSPWSDTKDACGPAWGTGNTWDTDPAKSYTQSPLRVYNTKYRLAGGITAGTVDWVLIVSDVNGNRRYPTGHQVEFYKSGEAGKLQRFAADPAWNSFGMDYTLDIYDRLIVEFNVTTGVFDLVSFDAGYYTP